MEMKRYIEKHDEANLGWAVKKLCKVNPYSIQSWYADLERDYSDWKFIIGEQHHIWQFPISDPEAKTGHRLMDDTAYYTLCWNSYCLLLRGSTGGGARKVSAILSFYCGIGSGDRNGRLSFCAVWFQSYHHLRYL